MTWTRKNQSRDISLQEYDREIFRSSVVSLFWNILAFRKRTSGFTQSDLAAKIGVHKSAPSRWFAGEKPNWEENTMADIANALDVELEIYARDRKTGMRFSPSGPVSVEIREVKTQSPDPDKLSEGMPKTISRKQFADNGLALVTAG